MKILFLLSQDLESPYGVGRCWPLARELARLGHQVQIAALHSNFDSLDATQQNFEDVEVSYVAPMHVMKEGDQKNYYPTHQLIGITLRAIWALSLFALKQSSDIIFVGKPHPMNGIAGLLTKIFRNVPLIVDCDDYEAASGRFSGKWQKNIIAFFEKRIPRYSKIVITNTHFMQDNLISWAISKDKIVYLPNGVDPRRFLSPDPARIESERTRLKLTGKKVVAYIGSLSIPSHPVHILVEAFAQLHQEIPETVLLIVGGGEDMVFLKKQVTKLGIEEATRFVGRVPPKDIPLYYALSDVSTDPIHDDAAARGRSPLKLFESWICGVPFVTAKVGEREFLIGDPPVGELVSSGQKALAIGIQNVLLNPELATIYKQRGKERVKNYHWSILVKQLEDVFLKLIP